MEPSSASPSWARSPRATSTDSPPPFASLSPDANKESGRRIAGSGDSSGDLRAPKKEDVDAIVESTTDPINRYYRYPAARALLPFLGKLPITPNHVTYAHIVIGAVAASIVAFTHAPHWLVLAFVLLEVRAILDCFDGVLARARGTSSPFGRALDEIADTVALILLVISLNYRLQTGVRGIVIACVLLAIGGLCANAWDYYKRVFTIALRDGKDGALDEIRQKKKVIERGNAGVLAYWGVYFDSFQYWLYDVVPTKGDRVSIIRSHVNNPAFRRTAKLLAFLSFDNGLSILGVGVLTGRMLEAEVVTIVWALVMWTATMLSARTVLRTPLRTEEQT